MKVKLKEAMDKLKQAKCLTQRKIRLDDASSTSSGIISSLIGLYLLYNCHQNKCLKCIHIFNLLRSGNGQVLSEILVIVKSGVSNNYLYMNNSNII